MRRHAAVAVLIGALVAVAPAAVQRAETVLENAHHIPGLW